MDDAARHTADTLVALAYDELRAAARRCIAREGPGHTLQPTALVHEAWMRLQKRRDLQWRSRTHFIAIAASEMRRVLVEHARAARAQKRGREFTLVSLDEAVGTSPPSVEILALDQALDRLGHRSPRQTRR